nr:hypothetical protein [Sphingomonas bisphenolicum]
MAHALDQTVLAKTAHGLARDAGFGEIMGARNLPCPNEGKRAIACHSRHRAILCSLDFTARATRCRTLQNRHRQADAGLAQNRGALEQRRAILFVPTHICATGQALRSGKIGQKCNLAVADEPGARRKDCQAATAGQRRQPCESLPVIGDMAQFEVATAPQAGDGLFFMDIASIERTARHHASPPPIAMGRAIGTPKHTPEITALPAISAPYCER